MPGRNIVKKYDINAYYHIYNRGVDKRTIFVDDQDYAVFVALIKRYLDVSLENGSKGRPYIDLRGKLEVMAFCLMPNHFHLLLYQIEIGGITELMRAVCSSYTTYFNKKYERIGPLFQGNFKAILVNSDVYLQYISRYIHRNPDNYIDWEWSSLSYWLGDKTASWLNPQRLNQLNREQYLAYIKDDTGFNKSVAEVPNLIF